VTFVAASVADCSKQLVWRAKRLVGQILTAILITAVSPKSLSYWFILK